MPTLYNPSLERLEDTALDITNPQFNVQVELREDGKVLWVNVGPVCVLRICGIPNAEIKMAGVRLTGQGV